MKTETFIRAFFEENIINYENNYRTDSLFGEYFNSRFISDQMIANKYISNTTISRNEIDWDFANRVYKDALDWKNSTIYNIDPDLVSKTSTSIVYWDNLKNKRLINFFNELIDKWKITKYLYSNDILLVYQKAVYYVNFSKRLLVKFFESKYISMEEINVLVLSVPWRLMIIYGELGLQKSYLEAGKICYFIEESLNDNKINFIDKNLIFNDEEKKYGYTTVEKKVIRRFEVQRNAGEI
ncbi:hypothetical protein [Enterococcus faecium]|uniref:Uncharacterized protein n=1 Tax=Enterococcus faecium TaxID=1352 RepID=A0A242ARQ6_ENTFC|nr:hypothetical protein [Enterococcus faecium]OTN83647.1 hypothetical protein A5810_003128 [Enterococcus faecium]